MKNSEHRFQRLCSLIIICFFISTPFLTSCGGGGGDGGGDDSEQNGVETLTVEYTVDPDNPLLVSVDIEDGGEYGFKKINIYSFEDEEESEYRFTHLYVEGEENPFRFVHNDTGRIESLHAPDGSAVSFSYSSDTLYANYITVDGQVGIYMTPIEGKLKEYLDKLENRDTTPLSNESNDETSKGSIIVKTISIFAEEDYPKTYSTTFIMRVSVAHVTPSGSLKGIVSIDGAKVSCPDPALTCEYVGSTHGPFDVATSTQTDYIWIKGTIDVVIERDDIMYEVNICKKDMKSDSDWMTLAGVGLGAIGLACTAVPWISIPVGIAGIVGGLHSYTRPDTCEYFADRNFALEKAEELGITVEPYSYLYDITFAETVKASADTDCPAIGDCIVHGSNSPVYDFTYNLKDDFDNVTVPCDSCPVLPESNSSQISSSDSVTIYRENPDLSGMDFLPPGNESVCAVQGPEEGKWYVLKLSGVGYHKTYGEAAKVTGYEYQALWLLPSEVDAIVGTDIDNATACESGPWPGPVLAPSIWESRSMEKEAGPLDSYDDVAPYRCPVPNWVYSNPICNQWVFDYDYAYYDDINSLCGF